MLESTSVSESRLLVASELTLIEWSSVRATNSPRVRDRNFLRAVECSRAIVTPLKEGFVEPDIE